MKHSLGLRLMPAQPRNLQQTPISETVAPATQESLHNWWTFKVALWSVNCMWLSIIHTHMTLLQYYTGSKQPSYIFTTMQMFTT